MRFYAFSYFHWGIMKSSEKSRTLRYGLTEDFFSKGQKTTGGGGVQRPPPHGLEG